jgi:hypothetical protein
MPAAVLLLEDAAFNNTIVGIASDNNDLDLLKLLEVYVNSSMFRYYQYLTSSTWGVERSVLEENEILSFPFALPERDLQSHILALRERVLEEPSNYELLLRELDDVVFEAFELGEADVDLVFDTLSELREPNDPSPPTSISDSELHRYVDVILSSLRPLVDRVTVTVAEVGALPHYTAATVRLLDEPRELPSQDLWALLSKAWNDAVADAPSPVAIVQPSLMILQGATAFLLKPTERRYWTASRAREDAGKILGAIMAASPVSAG